MLKNFPEQNTVLQSLQNSEFTFYLTGSIYFQGAGNDLDFFVEYSQTNLNYFLESLGFQSISNPKYGDSETVNVYRYFYSFYQIDIQVVKNATCKQKIQEVFKSVNILSPTREQWELGYSLYKAMNPK